MSPQELSSTNPASINVDHIDNKAAEEIKKTDKSEHDMLVLEIEN